MARPSLRHSLGTASRGGHSTSMRTLAQRQAVALDQARAADAVPAGRRTQLTHAGALAGHAGLGDAAEAVARAPGRPGRRRGPRAGGSGPPGRCGGPTRGCARRAGAPAGPGPGRRRRAGARRWSLQQDGVALADVEHASRCSPGAGRATRTAETATTSERRHAPHAAQAAPAAPTSRSIWRAMSSDGPEHAGRTRGAGSLATQATRAQDARDRSRLQVEWSGQLQVGQGHVGEQLRAARHQHQRQPRRQQQRGKQSAWPAACVEQRPHEDPGGGTEHGQRHDRRHQQVGQGRDQREAPEVQQDERQRRELRSQRHAQRLAEPAWRSGRA